MQLFLSSDFNIRSLRKKPKSMAQKLKDLRDRLRAHNLTKIGRALEEFVPATLFEKHRPKTARRRIFSTENTFWGFFLQVLQEDSSCQSIVHQFRISASQKSTDVSASTSAYCQARKRLPSALLSSVFEHTAKIKGMKHPLVKRRVICADGTGLLASDTVENQDVWPQQANQREGCAFPQLRLCALFNLHTGIALDYRLGNKRSHELPLLREQEASFKKNDIFIGDKGFICFYDQARLLERGVDSIVALAKRKPVPDNKADKRFGKDDILITIPKFTSATARSRYPQDRWDELPKAIQMRQIKVSFSVPGYRSTQIYLLTTLLDDIAYPANVIAELYRQRWGVELYFRDLKTTLGMEFLKSKTPDMVEKEIQMFFIVFNIIRHLMEEGKTASGSDILAFKSCVQTVIAYCNDESFSSSLTPIKHKRLLLREISKCCLFQRPERIEPRCVKRRPKPFKLMMKPRSELKREMLAKYA